MATEAFRTPSTRRESRACLSNSAGLMTKRTTTAKTAMIATTINSSINVNPRREESIVMKKTDHHNYTKYDDNKPRQKTGKISKTL
jgi:hypothetical protein